MFFKTQLYARESPTTGTVALATPLGVIERVIKQQSVADFTRNAGTHVRVFPDGADGLWVQTALKLPMASYPL